MSPEYCISADLRRKIASCIKIAVEVQNLTRGIIYILSPESPHVIELAKPARRFSVSDIRQIFFMGTGDKRTYTDKSQGTSLAPLRSSLPHSFLEVNRRVWALP